MIARQTALTGRLLASRRDIHPDAAVGRDPSCGTSFVDDIAVDDLQPETILRIARAAPRIDGDAPASIEGRRRHHTLLRARVERTPPVRPLCLGTGGLGRLAGFARRVEFTATLNGGGGRLRKNVGCPKRTNLDKHAHYCCHISTP